MMLRQILSQHSIDKKRPIDKIEHEISFLKTRIQKLEDGYADGQISAEVMTHSTNRYKKEIDTLLKEILQQGRLTSLPTVP